MRIKCLLAILLATSLCFPAQKQQPQTLIELFRTSDVFKNSRTGEGDLSFFTDVLYSYSLYEGYPQSVHYRIDESTADLALGVGLEVFYLGGYAQFPLKTELRVSEWTIEDFDGLSRTPSFSFMGGMRIAKKNFGVDLRLLLGQGPGQFISKKLGDHWLGKISLGVMGGF